MKKLYMLKHMKDISMHWQQLPNEHTMPGEAASPVRQ